MTRSKRCLVVAEAGVNHDGSLAAAVELVHAAREAGADVVKFQTFDPDRMVAADLPRAPYQRREGARRAATTQHALLRRLALPEEAFAELRDLCRRVGIRFLSTPFDLGSVALLRRLRVTAFKVSSGELTNAPLLHAVARARRPVLLSTGLARRAEIERALGVLAHGFSAAGPPDVRALPGLDALRTRAAPRVTLLHCVSAYPVPLAQANLPRLAWLRDTFGLPVGYSDHTLGRTAPIVAVALGATVVEKHLTLDRRGRGVDHAVSLEPADFAAMVREIRDAEAVLEPGGTGPQPCERENAAYVRPGLVALGATARTDRWTPDTLGVKRGGRRSPADYWRLLGRPCGKTYAKDEPL